MSEAAKGDLMAGFADHIDTHDAGEQQRDRIGLIAFDEDIGACGDAPEDRILLDRAMEILAGLCKIKNGGSSRLN